MNAHASIARLAASAVAALSIALAVGCGGDDGGLGSRYAVSGTVTYKGEPVKKGTINFVPNDPNGHAATGNIVDGAYSLTTLNPGDGALPGTYKVTVDDRVLDAEKLKGQADEQAKKKGLTYNAIPQELQAKMLAQTKGSLPGKYQIATTSDVEKEVKAQSNKIDVELKD